MTEHEHELERIVDYVLKKKIENPNLNISKEEVILFYAEMKAINHDKAYIRTLNYIDNYKDERRLK